MSSLQMPKIDSSILSKKDKIVSDIGRIINPKNVLSHPDELRPFETDGLTAYRQMPLVVVMPETVKEVSKILKYCNENKIKVVPRGAGTGLSGGSMPLEDCVLIGLWIQHFRLLIEIDIFFVQFFNNFVWINSPQWEEQEIAKIFLLRSYFFIAPDKTKGRAWKILIEERG